MQHKTHVDTVLGYRQSFLKGAGKGETDQRFLQFASEVCVYDDEDEKNDYIMYVCLG